MPPVASPPGKFEELFAQAGSAAAAKNFPRAIELYAAAIAVDPSHAESYYKRGNALKDLGRLEPAIASYDQAIQHKSDYAYAYCNRSFVEHRLGRLDAALSSVTHAIELDPADALAHYNRALVLQDLDRWEEALADYERAIALNPDHADAHYNRALASLFLGDFARGWPAYESRWRHAQRLGIGEAKNLSQPLWLGQEPIAGKRLLLHSEAGLGDTIQFCRYATLCAELGATVLLEVQAPLLDLLSTLDGVSQVIVQGSVLPPFDAHCPLMSLPLAFKTTLNSIPAPIKYLHSEARKVAHWRAQLGERGRPRIGLAWSGNPRNPIDARRSIALAGWVPHLPPEFQYFCLQTQVREADAAVLEASDCIFSFDDSLSFADTAALCDCMDLVISVDTSIAHLSGALGRPTWVPLASTPDWRWLRGRSDTPWYPSLTLYRQSSAGDWDSVLARIAADLRRRFP